MPTTEFALSIRDATGQDGLFTGNLRLDGVMLVPELRAIGPKDGAALGGIWRDPSAVSAQRIGAMLAEHGLPGLDIAIIEIRRAEP